MQRFLHQKSRLKEEYSFRRYLIFLTSLLLVLLVFTFKQVREKQKAVRKTELMMQELHHRVKNNLQTIISIMRLQSRQITDKIALEELNDSRTRLEAMALIHQQLYVTDKEETINFRLFIESLIQKYGFTYNLTVEDFHTSIDFDEENIKVDRAIPLGLIANEMIVNSMKYGKNIDVPLQINISLKKRVFCYSDNGSGYAIVPDYDTQLQGFGLRLVASLSEQLKCTYHFFNDNGAHFELRPILSPST